MKRLEMSILSILCAMFSFAAAKESGTPASTPAPATEMVRSVDQDRHAMSLEGEQRFRTNCGRCHQAPHKFPPRMMGTIVRHMRVRATLTDEDMKSILAYMTE